MSFFDDVKEREKTWMNVMEWVCNRCHTTDSISCDRNYMSMGKCIRCGAFIDNPRIFEAPRFCLVVWTEKEL